MTLTLVPPTQPAAATQPAPTTTKRKRYKNPPHVRIRPPRPAQRKLLWSLEWKNDPLTGRRGTLTLPDKCKSFEVAYRWALKKSNELQELRTRKRVGENIAPPAARVAVFDEAQRYLDKLAADGCSDASVRNAEDALRELSEWCARRKCTAICDLSFELLQDWVTEQKARKKANGKPRAYTSVNQDLKIVGAMLTHANKQRRAPQWGTDARRAVLELIKPAAAVRARHETIRVLSVIEICNVLAAAVAFDRAQLRDRPKYRRLLSPDIALILLTAMRRAELTQALVSDVQLSAASKHDAKIRVAEIRLRDGTTKGGIGRTVPLTDFTVQGIELLQEITRGRQPYEWLSENGYQTLGSKLTALCDQRGFAWPVDADGSVRAVPADLCVKMLRTTCCTYELHLTGVSDTQILKRQGHTKEVADRHYFDDGKLPRQPALELVMQCTAELQAVIDLVRARNAKHVLPRVEKRKKPQPEVRGLQPKTPLQSGPGRKRSAAAG